MHERKSGIRLAVHEGESDGVEVFGLSDVSWVDSDSESSESDPEPLPKTININKTNAE